MIRSLLIGAASLALVLAHADAATYTLNVPVTAGAYVDLGAGPLDIGLNGGGPVALVLSDTLPPKTLIGPILSEQFPAKTFCQASHVWALALRPGGAIVNTTPATCTGSTAGDTTTLGNLLAAIISPLTGQSIDQVHIGDVGQWGAALWKMTFSGNTGGLAQTTVPVTNASTALLTANQFTNFESICLAATEPAGIWINWTGVAAVKASPSELLMPGYCKTWLKNTGYLPTGAAFAISNTAATVAATIEGN